MPLFPPLPFLYYVKPPVEIGLAVSGTTCRVEPDHIKPGQGLFTTHHEDTLSTRSIISVDALFVVDVKVIKDLILYFHILIFDKVVTMTVASRELSMDRSV